MYLDYEVQENEEILEIFPKDLIFLFELSDTECHAKLTGRCSLEKFWPDKRLDQGEDSDFNYCRNILKSLKRHGITELVDIIKYNCGHYAFNDGQHRICIAKRKGLKLKALITTVDDESCDVCRNRPIKNADLR